MFDSIVTLIAVTVLLLGSPGPAPLALAGISAVFGIKQGLSFLLGVLAGLGVAILAAAIGLTALFGVYPNAKGVLQFLGVLYILFIAYKIASAPVLANSEMKVEGAPTFTDGFILNLLNPKAYAAFLAIFSQFLLPLNNVFLSHLLTGLICLLVAAVVDSLWLCLGGLLSPLFQAPQTGRVVRVLFALLMVAAVFWALRQ